MGDIKQVLVEKEVPTPEFNERLVVELCENVHLHYRNLRLEFGKDEFFALIRALKRIDDNRVLDFEYGHDKFKCILSEKLPPATEFDKRLQIEEQVGGGYHVHYRNLRLEIKDLSELGIKDDTKTS